MTEPSKRLVRVEWNDAGCDSSWQSPGTVFQPAACVSVGWLWHEDDEVVMVVGTMALTGEFNQTMTIPRAMVKTIKDLPGA